MTNYLGYKCSLCKKEFPPMNMIYSCPSCGGNLDVVLDYEGIRQKFHPEDILSRAESSLWRYEPLLPVTDPGGFTTPIHAAGWTPINLPERISLTLGLRR